MVPFSHGRGEGGNSSKEARSIVTTGPPGLGLSRAVLPALLFLPPLPPDRLRLLDRGMGRGQSGDGDAEGAAADVVQADLVAELDGLGVAAVLAADAAL